MKFVQFALKDVSKLTRIGLQTAGGTVLDLTDALPNCLHLVDALSKFGSDALMDIVQR